MVTTPRRFIHISESATLKNVPSAFRMNSSTSIIAKMHKAHTPLILSVKKGPIRFFNIIVLINKLQQHSLFISNAFEHSIFSHLYHPDEKRHSNNHRFLHYMI